ncbi:MAG: hypothetical protein U1E76_23790 [Planctomycetota bacterium]
MDEHFHRNYENQTTLHPLALVAIVVLGIAVLAAPRHRVLVPVLLMACFLSSAQRIAIASLDFSLIRIMVIFGWTRLFARGEFGRIEWKPIDTVFVLWSISGAIAYIALHGDSQAIIYKCGNIFESAGLYFLFRHLIRDLADIDRVTAAAIAISVPVALFFVFERFTGRNLFSVFGGVPAVTIVREGRLRCQGAFAHAIIAGCFWASFMPLMFVRRWLGAAGKRSATIGLLSAGSIVVNCASSTPIMAVLFSIVGALMFMFRRSMRAVRWTLVIGLFLLHMTMEAPVWYLIARMDVVAGSTGWHRSKLIDEAVRHFGEWWLLGTESTEKWQEYLADVTNQYVLEGVRGGAITLLLFLVMIALAFQGVGKAWRRFAPGSWQVALTWALGVALFVHVMNFFAISYFGQIVMVWYLLLAMIGSITPRNGMRPQPASS